MKKLNNKGVTLVELIVSFAIVGVAIIYFFQTLYTVKKIYTSARNETNDYVNVTYDLKILNQHFNMLERDYTSLNYCDRYNLSCKEVKFAGYFSDKDLSDENDGEDGNVAARDAAKNNELKGYKLKVGYDTDGNGTSDKFYYLYKTFRKLNDSNTAILMPYFPGETGSITGNKSGNYSSRYRVIAARGEGTVANYEFYKDFTTDYNGDRSGIGIVFSMATNCDNARNKTTFIFGESQEEVIYTGKNWDDANIYEYTTGTNPTHERNNGIFDGQMVDPVEGIIYNRITYDGKHSFRYLDKNGNEVSESDAINKHVAFSVEENSLHLHSSFSTNSRFTGKIKIKVELLPLNGSSLSDNCAAYTSITSIHKTVHR